MGLNGLSVVALPEPLPNDPAKVIKHGGLAATIGAIAGVISAGAIVANNPEYAAGEKVLAAAIGGVVTAIVSGILGALSNWFKPHYK